MNRDAGGTVAERRRAESAVLGDATLLQVLLDAMPVGVLVLDSETPLHFTAFNDRAALLHGWSAEAFARLTLADIDAQRTAEQVRERARIVAALPAGHRFQTTVTHRHRDGRLLDLLVTVCRVDLGDRRMVVAALVDVTDRMEAERTLRSNEAFVRRITDVAPSILYVYDVVEKRNVWGNRVMFELLGYRREDLEARAGNLVESLLHPDDLAPNRVHAGRLAALADGQIAELTYRMRRADGSWCWLHSRDMIFERDADGTPRRIVGAAHDVTDLETAKHAAAASAERLLLAQRASGIGIHDFDIERDVIFWDERTRRLWGVGPEEPIDFATFARGVLPDDLPAVEAALAAALDPAGSGIYEAEYRVVHRSDGAVRHVAATGRTAFRDGRAVRLVGTVRDVTAERQLEAALREADRRKDEFVAMLAHELRNPLAPLRTSLRVLERETLSVGGQHALRMCERQSGQLARLVDDLLDLSRISRGDIVLRPEWVNIGMTVHHAVEVFADECERRGHRVRVVLPQEPLRIRADPARLAQIVENLLHNACKYTPDGGEIRIEAEGDDATATLRVIDNGVGIEPALQASIFELFSRIDGPAEHSQGGLGIGLALVRRLVQLHGGSVSVASEGVGRGATFTVTLPRGGT